MTTSGTFFEIDVIIKIHSGLVLNPTKSPVLMLINADRTLRNAHEMSQSLYRLNDTLGKNPSCRWRRFWELAREGLTRPLNIPEWLGLANEANLLNLLMLMMWQCLTKKIATGSTLKGIPTHSLRIFCMNWQTIFVSRSRGYKNNVKNSLNLARTKGNAFNFPRELSRPLLTWLLSAHMELEIEL